MNIKVVQNQNAILFRKRETRSIVGKLSVFPRGARPWFSGGCSTDGLPNVFRRPEQLQDLNRPNALVHLHDILGRE